MSCHGYDSVMLVLCTRLQIKLLMFSKCSFPCAKFANASMLLFSSPDMYCISIALHHKQGCEPEGKVMNLSKGE